MEPRTIFALKCRICMLLYISKDNMLSVYRLFVNYRHTKRNCFFLFAYFNIKRLFRLIQVCPDSIVDYRVSLIWNTKSECQLSGVLWMWGDTVEYIVHRLPPHTFTKVFAVYHRRRLLPWRSTVVSYVLVILYAPRSVSSFSQSHRTLHFKIVYT